MEQDTSACRYYGRKKITKSSLAEKLKTSHFQLDCILDPENSAITQEVLEHVAHAVGKNLRIEFS